MNWANFKNLVKSLMPGDAMRQNCSAIIDLHTKVGVRHIQRLVPQYQTGHITEFEYADGTLIEPYAMEFNYSSEMVDVRPRELWIVGDESDGLCYRALADDVPWESRFDLKCNTPRKFAVAWNPKGTGFWISPALEEGYKCELHWDGIYSDWGDEDECGLDIDEADAVADYVRSEIRKEVDRDHQAAQAFYASWMAKVRRLHVDKNMRTKQSTLR